jgi:signal transduction histidine kinase
MGMFGDRISEPVEREIQAVLDMIAPDGAIIHWAWPGQPPHEGQTDVVLEDTIVGGIAWAGPPPTQASTAAQLTSRLASAALSERNSAARQQLSTVLRRQRVPRSLADATDARRLFADFLTVLEGATPGSTASLTALPGTPPELERLLSSTAHQRGDSRVAVVEAVTLFGESALLLSIELPQAALEAERIYAVKLVRHAAANLSAIVSFALRSFQSAARDDQFSRLLEGFATMYALVYERIADDADAERSLDAVLDCALEVLGRAVPTSTVNDVRWLRTYAGRRELYFRRVAGVAWQGAGAEIKEKTYALDAREKLSKGAKVFLTGLPELVPDVSEDSDYDMTFRSVTSIVIAPVKVKNERLGLLDVRSESGPLSDLDKEVVVAMGQQLGLIGHLIGSIREAREAQREQLQSFEDLRHQLLNPVQQLERRVHGLLNRSDGVTDRRSRAHLYQVRGLARRTSQVTRSLTQFVELAQGRTLSIRPSLHSADDLMKILEIAARDAEIVSIQRIVVNVDNESIRSAIVRPIAFDRELINQAVGSLFDNAGKYGYRRSEVEVRAMANRNTVAIEVLSVGARIHPMDVPRCKERGWRGSSADGIELAGGGSGIGLWIVDKIMIAHRGRLDITVDKDQTRVKLTLPIRKDG